MHNCTFKNYSKYLTTYITAKIFHLKIDILICIQVYQARHTLHFAIIKPESAL
jgi:hypothetical protein